ncbi:MAG: hypothetical protein JKP98_24675 [Rhodobacteraceae bacterium]|nr:hypothetical protein [Paracoccaceae bacterium]
MKGLRPYTVVAETPRLTASVFLPQCGTYGGGGRFDASGRLRILNDALDPVPWPPILPPRTMDDVPDPLLLRGWSEERRGGYSYFSKRFKGDWWLQRSCQIPSRASKVADRLGYRLYHPKTETAGPRPFWGWADILDGRLFYAAEGCLWSARPHGDGKEVDVRCIKDFSRCAPIHGHEPLGRTLMGLPAPLGRGGGDRRGGPLGLWTFADHAAASVFWAAVGLGAMVLALLNLRGAIARARLATGATARASSCSTRHRSAISGQKRVGHGARPDRPGGNRPGRDADALPSRRCTDRNPAVGRGRDGLVDALSALPGFDPAALARARARRGAREATVWQRRGGDRLPALSRPGSR